MIARHSGRNFIRISHVGTQFYLKTVVVEKKWMAAMEQRIHTEMDNISHRLTQRIKELADRYETPLPLLTRQLSEVEAKSNPCGRTRRVRSERLAGIEPA